MNKVIFNSISLQKFIWDFITPLIPEDDEYEVEIKCKDKNFWFESPVVEQRINIECQNDFEVKVEIGHLRRLARVLSKIQEQPLVVTFKNYDWITVDGIVV